ncbi:MAG: 2-hydroxychromene-2-carboxylate isomerase [Pseudomonadota bacterium]
MTKTIDFYFDFASPNCYLAAKALPAIANEIRAEIIIRPVLLGGIFKATNNQAPMQAFANVKGKLAYDMLEIRRFVERHGLSAFQMNPNFPINTLPLMRALIAAQEAGVAEAYIDAGLKGMWEEGLAMGDPDIAKARIAEAGVDADALFQRAQTPEIKQKLIDDTSAAVDRGIFGLPTFFVGDEIFFGKERLEQVREAAA